MAKWMAIGQTHGHMDGDQLTKICEDTTKKMFFSQ